MSNQNSSTQPAAPDASVTPPRPNPWPAGLSTAINKPSINVVAAKSYDNVVNTPPHPFGKSRAEKAAETAKEQSPSPSTTPVRKGITMQAQLSTSTAAPKKTAKAPTVKKTAASAANKADAKVAKKATDAKIAKKATSAPAAKKAAAPVAKKAASATGARGRKPLYGDDQKFKVVSPERAKRGHFHAFIQKAVSLGGAFTRPEIMKAARNVGTEAQLKQDFGDAVRYGILVPTK